MSAAAIGAPAVDVAPGEHLGVRILRIAVSVLSWGSLAFFAIWSIGGPLFGSGIFLGTDVFQVLAPWTSAFETHYTITNGMIGDTIDTVTPQAWSIVEAAKHGVFAAWNPWVGGGTELGALPNSGVYSPLSVAWWVFPLEYAPGATKLIEIAVSTLGMSLLLRRLGTPNAAWAIGSLLFVSSGFMVSWTNWPQTRVAALIPLLFWALDRATVLRRLRDAVPVGLVLAGMFLGGFPAVVGYALYAGGAYVVVRSVAEHRSWLRLLQSAASSALGVVLGGLLSACLLLPFAVNATSVLDFSVREQTAADSLAPTDLATAVIPQLVGHVSSGASWMDGSPIERLSYLGVAAVLLVLAAVLSRSRSRRGSAILWFFLGATILSALLLYFGGPLLEAAQRLPIFSNNPIGRLRVLSGFFVAVLAALGFAAVGGAMLSGRRTASPAVNPGLDADTDSADARPVRPWSVWVGRGLRWAAAALILVVLADALWDGLSQVPEEFWPPVQSGAIVSAWIGAAVVLVLLLGRFGRFAAVRLAVIGLVPLAIVAPALALTDQWWPVSASATVYAETPALTFLGEHLGDERYVSVGQAGFPGANTMYRLRSVDGHAYQTAEWKQLLRGVDEDIFITPTYSSLPSARISDSLSSPILDRLGVRYALMGPGVTVPGEQREELAGGGSMPISPEEPVRSGIRSGPVRAVTIMFDGSQPSIEQTTLTIDIVDAATGERLASTSTWFPWLSGQEQVAVTGDAIPADTSWYAEVSIDSGASRLLAAGLDPTVPSMTTTVPVDDGLTVVHTGDATILERTSADQRVRWAEQAVVSTDEQERLALLADPELPASTVVLEHEGDAGTASPPGAGAEDAVDADASDVDATSGVTAMRDDAEAGVISVTTEASAAGWLVFDDSLRRPGWSVTIEGRAAELLDADHVGGAVAVPAGTHTVELRYLAPGLSTGLLVSAGTAGLLVLAFGTSLTVRGIRASRRRRADRAKVDEPTGDAQTTGV